MANESYKSKFTGNQVDELLTIVNENKNNIISKPFINGYINKLPFISTNPIDYINWINEHSETDVTINDSSIFENKTCNCFYMIQNNDSFYILFSEYPFSLSFSRSNQEEDIYICNSLRKTQDETDHIGYSTGIVSIQDGLSLINEVTISGISETDCESITDNNINIYISSNVIIYDTTDYQDDIINIQNNTEFYLDSNYETVISPETEKIYIDIPTGNLYEWNGSKYTLVGGGDVPTKTSQLTNDSGFITKDVNNLTNYYKKTEIDEDKQNKLTEGDGIDITEDVIAIDPMPAADIDEVVDIIPSGGRVAVTGYVPLGTLISYYGETAPRFFLACDGATYNKADYPELAEHLLSLTNHSQYEVSGDDTKFKVPDLRGEFVRGTGTNSHANQGSGAAVGTHQDGTSHRQEAFNSTSGWWGIYKATSDTTQYPMSISDYDSMVASAVGYISNANTYTAEVGAASLVTSRPTNTSVLFCIAYKDIYSNPMNDYSTDEKVVGTWIDGKTIWQKSIPITIPNCVTEKIPVFDTIVLDVMTDALISINGYVKANPHVLPIPFVLQQSDGGITAIGIRITTQNASQLLQFYNSNPAWNGVTGYVTIQYTKTTS